MGTAPPLEPLPLWFWPALVAGMLALICSCIFLVSRFGGWHDWARRFPGGPVRPAGVIYRWCSARRMKGATYYRGSLNVTPAPGGVYVTTGWMLRPCHPPLLLPWTCVRRVEEEGGPYWRGLVLYCEADDLRLRLYLPPGTPDVMNWWQQAAARSTL